MHSTLTDVSGNEVVPRDIALHETVLVSTADLDVDFVACFDLRYLGARRRHLHLSSFLRCWLGGLLWPGQVACVELIIHSDHGSGPV